MRYRVDRSRLSIREVWNFTRSWRVVIALLNRWSGAIGPTGQIFRDLGPISEARVAWSEMPADARAAFEAKALELTSLGFVEPIWYRHASEDGSIQSYGAAARHSSLPIVANVNRGVNTATVPPTIFMSCSLGSRRADGTLLATSDTPSRFLSPPNVKPMALEGAPLGILFEAHQRRIAKLGDLLPVPDDEALIAAVECVGTEARDFHLARGVYVRVPDEEPSSPAPVADPPDSSADTFERSVLAAIDAQQRPKRNWQSFVTVAIVTLVLFVAIGGSRWSWDFAAILAGVVLVHELGHYVAMKIFGYQNLRIFFVPLLGAATAGTHYNVAGWKKGLVSLAGPLPGIAAGLALTIAGSVAHSPLLLQIATVSFLLNGLNLLPIMPLDGGWTAHAVLFCRHPLLETLSRVVAVAGGLVLGLLLGAPAFAILAVLMALSIPSTHRLAALADRLRVSGVPAASADQKSIPRETALTILRELRKDGRMPEHATLRAQEVLSVFERLNSTPPGWLASFALVTIQAGGFLAAAIGAVLAHLSR